MWEKRREMRSANLFIAFSRRQAEEIILSLSGKKLVSVQDGAAIGRKLVELTCVYVCMWKWLAEELLCSLGRRCSVYFLMGRRTCLKKECLQGNIVLTLTF